MGPFPPGMPLASRTRANQANQQSAGGVGVSTPCGAVSNRGTTVFVPGVLKLQMHGRIYDAGMGTYHLPSFAVVVVLKLQMRGRIYDAGMGTYHLPSLAVVVGHEKSLFSAFLIGPNIVIFLRSDRM